MTYYFDYPTTARVSVKRGPSFDALPGSDKAYAEYYAVLKGLLLRGGYCSEDLHAEAGANFNLERVALRRMRSATIDLKGFSLGSNCRSNTALEIARWEDEGGGTF